MSDHLRLDGIQAAAMYEVEIRRLRAEVEQLTGLGTQIVIVERERDEALAQVAVLIKYNQKHHFGSCCPLPDVPTKAHALLDRLQKLEAEFNQPFDADKIESAVLAGAGPASARVFRRLMIRLHRVEALGKEAQEIMKEKGSYDTRVDPRVQREYERAYAVIQALAAWEEGK